MIWQAPWAWIGAAALAIPIAVHLLTRRQARRLAFPTLRFLVKTESSAIRLHRLTDPMLFAIRAAVVIAAVAALAQPYVVAWGRNHADDSALSRAVVIDASANMQRVTGGAAAIDAARTRVRTLAPAATATSTIEAANLRSGLAQADAWLATTPGRHETVIVSDFKIGAIDAADLASVPASTGLRFVKIDSPQTTQIVGPSHHAAGHRIVPRIDVAPGWSEVRWLETEEHAGPPAGLTILHGPAEARASAAALEAVSTIGVPDDTPNRPTVIVLPDAPDRASLLSRARPINQPWMFDVVSRMNGLDGVVQPAVSCTVVDGVHRLSILPVSAEPVALAEIVAAALGAVAAAPLAELEPFSLSSETLRGWERPAGPPTPGANLPKDLSDGRWCWAAALALLGLETWMRRSPRAVAAEGALLKDARARG